MAVPGHPRPLILVPIESAYMRHSNLGSILFYLARKIFQRYSTQKDIFYLSEIAYCRFSAEMSAPTPIPPEFLRCCPWARLPMLAPRYEDPKLIRPPGTLVPEGLMLYCRCFFSFRPATSELPRPIAVKLCHMIAIWVLFIMQVQKFGGPSPKEIGGQNMQNTARFQTTFEFYCEYLRNGSRYPKIGKRIDRERFLPLSTRKVRRTLVH